MSNSSRACLNVRLAADYALGKLSGETVVQVEEHLGKCPRCAALVEAQGDDSFVRGVKNGAPKEDSAMRTVGRQLTESMFDRARELEPTTDDIPSDLSRSTQYRVLAKVGQGGMGTVYKAEQVNLKRVVAALHFYSPGDPNTSAGWGIQVQAECLTRRA